ncbi:MAG TPA: response regulator [Puia sp.]|jgi:CheY-like chemotaxis protein|nr:response regulator [Puia sp.]
MNILLIDDDEDDRKLFFEAASEVDQTIACIGATNADEALLYLNDRGNPLPDFIFLDLRMPGLSGRQCLEEIKKDTRLEPVPVIVYTTSTDVRESMELKQLGAAHFMSKPVSPDDVYYMLSVVLGEKWT